MRTVLIAALALAGPAHAAPPPAAPPVSAAPVAVTWKRLPQQAWLCSRHGPDWDFGTGAESIGGRTWSGTFTLTVAPGQRVKFRAEAVAADHQPVTYHTTGWPAGAALDAANGTFEWVAAGEPGQRFSVEVAARTAGGEARTTFEVVVASEALQAAWKAGLGGKAWPDCDERPPEQKLPGTCRVN